MPILKLLSRVRDQMPNQPHPFMREDERSRICYLTGLAIQAHSDGQLADEEEAHLLQMAKLFRVEAEVASQILVDARRPDEQTINRIRQTLFHSKLKYYFILDLQIMAHQDHVVKTVESQVIERFGDILGLDREDREFLVSLADAVAEEDPVAKEKWAREFFQDSDFFAERSGTEFDYYLDR